MRPVRFVDAETCYQSWSVPPKKTLSNKLPKKLRSGISKIMFRVLDYLALYDDRIKSQSSYVKIKHLDSERTINLILKEMRIIEERYYVKPSRVLMGRDRFDELISDEDFNKYIRLSSNGLYINRNCEVYGMSVELIPWMEGVILVP